VLFSRNSVKPGVDETATVAPSASVVGNVTIAAGCYVGHGAVIESSGPPVELGAGVLVTANAVIRSTGGRHRPAFPVTIGADTLVAPQSVLIGCSIGADCYIATAVIVFQGADVGDGSRLGAGSIVHTRAVLPPASRVGLRQIAVPDDGGVRITSDLDEARRLVGQADFFKNVFDVREDDALTLHRRVIEELQHEMSEWHDEPTGPSPDV
jgi:carbonic anhydrase/acetyltransferase-like protein (isoleucine patch superfamily)